MTLATYQRPPVKVAVMGCGRAFFSDHFPVFKAHPSLFEIVAACDVIKARRDPILEVFPKCRMFRRYQDMLDERNFDLVDIISETKFHVAQALESLNRGHWTLLESPMAVTVEEAQLIRGAAVKAKNRLIVMNRGFFSAAFMLAKQAMSDPRLGEIYDIAIREEDYVRRDDWQTVKRLGGGAAYYAMPDLIMQALKLLPLPPVQMWSELKRIASLGDSEDFVRVNLRTRSQISAEVIYNGGCLPGARRPAIVISGSRGSMSVQPGAEEGVLHVVEPGYEFPRRRSSVRTPSLQDPHEDFKVVDIPYTLPRGTHFGMSEFWRRVYNSIRVADPFPVSMEDSIEAIKFAQLMKKTSPYGK